MIRLGLASLGALLMAGAACSKKPEPKVAPPVVHKPESHPQRPSGSVVVVEPQTMVLKQVLVEVSESKSPYELESKDLAKRLGARLLASGWLAAQESQVPDDHLAQRVEAMLNISYDITLAAGDQKGRVVVALEATLEFIDNSNELRPRVALLVEDTLKGSSEADVSSELNLLCQAALETAAASLVARERLRRSSHEELLSHLSVGSEDVGMKIWALRLAADRRLNEALPAGVAALSTDNEDVQAAAIALLVELGDTRAVAALSKGIDFKDYEQLRVVIEAVSAIGGEEATEFLEFVASGHPDDDMRARAKDRIPTGTDGLVR